MSETPADESRRAVARARVREAEAVTIRSLLAHLGDLLTEPGITEIAFNDPAELRIHYEKEGRWSSRPFRVPAQSGTADRSDGQAAAREIRARRHVSAIVNSMIGPGRERPQFSAERGERKECPREDDAAQIRRNYDFVHQLAIAVARYNDNDISDTNPILSAVLPDGERCQFVMPPATVRGTISMTIRRPSMEVRTIKSYSEGGFFDAIRPVSHERAGDAELAALYADIHRTDLPVERLREIRSRFLLRAVQLGRVVVVAGSTGSGKTTFMKTLMQAIPHDERIITIEDCPELMYGLSGHENRVHLMYSSEGGENAVTSASSMMKSCLRMKPDRILLAELRGGETYDWLQSVLSGHAGSITSCHAASCSAVFPYLAMKVMQSPVGKNIPYEEVMGCLKRVIDVVVHIQNVRGRRSITGIYFSQPSQVQAHAPATVFSP